MCVFKRDETSFRLPKDTRCCALLRSKLNNILSDTRNRKASKIEFRASWIDTDGNVKYNHIKLKTDEDLKIIWRTYHCRLTKGPIEFDAVISKFVDDIIKMLKRPESSSIVYILLFVIVLLSYVIVYLKLC